MPSPRAATLRSMFEPARYPAPPLDGIGTAWRYTVAGLLYVGLAAMIMAAASGVGEPELPTMSTAIALLDIGLGLTGLILVGWRRRWPLAITLIVLTFSVWSVSVAPAVAWASVSMSSRRNLPKIGIVLGYAVLTALVSGLLPHAEWWSPGSSADVAEQMLTVITAVAGQAILALIGMYYGVRQDAAASIRDRADNADRDRELAVLGERNRIAREMHDVLAHRISLVSMHAGVLAYRDDLPPEKTREIAELIRQNAHASLTELRSVLSTLRGPQADEDGHPAAPQPTLADLPRLLEDARGLGQRVTLHTGLQFDAVPEVTARHLYRIVQECLTNARKHAPRAAVELRLGGGPGTGIELRCVNELGRGPVVPGAGLGLVGVRERVQMMNGRLSTGPEGHTFVVACWLPWTT